MLAAHGVYGHIRNNDVRATALLAGFAVYVGLVWVAACLFFSAIGIELRVVSVQLETGHQLRIPHWLFALETAQHIAITYAWVPVVLAAGWLAYAYLMRKQLVREGTGAESTSRSVEPQLCNIVETLAISAGLPMPAIEIIETDALNAYASGWTPADSVVGVTRGLLRSLSKDELEAVLAHEMTHIRHRDVRLMTVAAIFVGFLASGARAFGAGKDGASTRNLALRTSGGAGILFVVAAAVIGALASALGLLSQFAISRSREFVADAGAVQLTKNPDALISALQKISAHGEMPAVPGPLRAMLIFSLPQRWSATHPSIESRIAALESYAGGRRAVAPIPPPGVQRGLQRGGMAAGGGAQSGHGGGAARPFGRRAPQRTTPIAH
jgi:heat shock protein HtpX